MRNASTLGGVARSRGFARWAGRLLHMLRRNSRRGARRNIVFHYDLGNDFYALWLDKSMSYSRDLFIDPETVRENLEEAQERKITAIPDRLAVGEGDCLLAISCGRAGLAPT